MKFYLLSPYGVPMNQVLFPTFIKTFQEEGHDFVSRIEDCEICMVDLHTRIADYDQRDVNWLCSSSVMVITFDEWDRGGMSDVIWPFPLTNQQEQIFDHCRLDGIKHAHFCRLLNKNDILDSRMYPYEKAIHYEEPITTADDIFNREYDVTYIANSAPSREKIKEVFEADGRIKCNIVLGAKKLPFNEWVDANRKSKFFIAASGGGYSCEKKQNLFSISAILQERTDQLLIHPFVHGENCLKFDQPPTKEDLDAIVEIVNDKERLHELYMNGYNFMKQYYSKESIASDILIKIIKHCQ